MINIVSTKNQYILKDLLIIEYYKFNNVIYQKKKKKLIKLTFKHENFL